MLDVLIVGAGPAGSIAALHLARSGARVRLVDRSRFPRDKLCGDTLNPGTRAILHRLGVGGAIDQRGLRIDGMILTGDGGIRVEGRYPRERHGRALVRRELDQFLLEHAMAAGAQFEERVTVQAPILDSSGEPIVCGAIVAGTRGRSLHVPARVTIAADGRRSTLAFGLGLAHHPAWPRRWAIGAYYDQVSGLSSFGEMHVRAGYYLGVAPLPGGLANACLVCEQNRTGTAFRSPRAMLERAIAVDPLLRDRFATAQLASGPVLLGPLAVDVTAAGVPGLLLAGDAAGFVDPMTGDGLRFAIRGGELAAEAALALLASGRLDAHVALERARQAAFSHKYRFNRLLRRLVASPAGVGVAAQSARVAPALLRRAIAFAGDATDAQAGLVNTIPS